MDKKLSVLGQPQAKLTVYSPTQVSFSSSSYIKTIDGHDEYEGAYVVIPSTDDQILDTNNKVMTQDLTVEAIPTWQTSNEYGITFIIGN